MLFPSAGTAILALLLVNASSAQPTEPAPPLGSRVFAWDRLQVHATPVGQRRDVCDQPTETLERFECHISTLNPGLASHPPHTHAQEELIILQRGTLDVSINGRIQRAEAGSAFWFASNDPHAVNNSGSEPATYFVFNFATAATRRMPKVGEKRPNEGKVLSSTIWHWDQLAVESTAVGERRAMVDSPTYTCRNLESHVTTLRAGQTPHSPHRHPDEEILLIREGEVEVTINGASERVGPGSIVFIGSGDEHGLRNVGAGVASYYVIRVLTEATPSS